MKTRPRPYTTATDADDADRRCPTLRMSRCRAADAGKFDTGHGPRAQLMIDSTSGALTFKEAPDEAPDYEIPCETRAGTTCMNVTVKVTDDGTGVGNKMTAMQDVTVIMVTNMEENSGRSTLIDPAASKVGFPVTATLADPDNVTVRVQRCYLAVVPSTTTICQIPCCQNTEDAPKS